ncbi:hypothetical protein B0T24DRAFT_224992 [Lasiosphaeria ovina]|uniref:Zn(2)-C6 fungal-type domain-containing protein n=1 Tax=Lasiosphaeria ovina TaxID=92902 RepID=A0AAE0KI54_9PEZI|nr:hypothetical protein B0T24DRAFT_224992 [Lasiosphaeria ovina]
MATINAESTDKGKGVAPSHGLARFACNFCKHKKIKCSRELPKCAACKPWPGICDYSRQVAPTNRSTSSGPTTSSSSNNLELEQRPKQQVAPVLPSDSGFSTDRLERVEAALETLTASVSRIVAASELGGVRDRESRPPVTRPGAQPTALLTEQSRKDEATFGALSFSAVGEAHDQLGQIIPLLAPQPEFRVAMERVNDLVKGLTSLRSPVTMLSLNSLRQYRTPDTETGNDMIKKYRAINNMCRVFFDSPSDSLLRQVIFKPSEAPPAWVIFVNYSLLISDLARHGLSGMWRWNTKMALDNAALFLSPSRMSIQAFILLSFRGEDFATPNVSWMLTSYACHQAQAMSFHIPEPDMDWGSQQRQLCLFWVLFTYEKWCALTFGRPALLPLSYFRDVRLPSFDYLVSSSSHPHTLPADCETSTSPIFAAHVFFQNIKLAKLTSVILDSLVLGGLATERDALKGELETWYLETIDLLRQAEHDDQDLLENENHEEAMQARATAKFRYANTMMVLIKDLPKYDGLRISLAREALQLLPIMLGSHQNMYNGVIWQLLYYPFTSFFTLLAHVIHHPQNPDVQADLALLYSIISYFTNLRLQLTLLTEVSLRLEHTAEVFFRIAQRHVQEQQSAAGRVYTELEVHVPNLSTAQHRYGLESDPNPEAAADPLAYDFGAEDFSLDDEEMDKFLSWLSPSFAADLSTAARGVDNAQEAPTNPSIPVHEDPPRGQKRPFGAAFDWFSWEKYYSDTT